VLYGCTRALEGSQIYSCPTHTFDGELLLDLCSMLASIPTFFVCAATYILKVLSLLGVDAGDRHLGDMCRGICFVSTRV
jgi:hypothetical protein